MANGGFFSRVSKSEFLLPQSVLYLIARLKQFGENYADENIQGNGMRSILNIHIV